MSGNIFLDIMHQAPDIHAFRRDFSLQAKHTAHSCSTIAMHYVGGLQSTGWWAKVAVRRGSPAITSADPPKEITIIIINNILLPHIINILKVAQGCLCVCVSPLLLL